jgi:DNA polymerase III gamma/tau subunit
VRDVLGFMPAHLLNDAIEALADRYAVRLVETVGIVSDQGLHLGQFVRELMAEMRHLLLARLGLGDRVTGSDEDRTRVQAHAGRFSEQELIRLFDVLLEIEGELRWTSEPRFRLEVGCIRLARIARMRDLEEVIREIRELPATPASGAEPVRAPGPATASARGGPSSPADPPVRKSPAPSKVKAPEARVRSAVAAVSPSPERSPEPTASGKAEPGDNGPAAKPTPGPRPRPADGDDGDEGAADDPMLESARSEPVVRKFLDVFRGEIAHVKSTKSSDSNEGGAS